MEIADKARFWSKVATGKPDECWEWRGSAGTGGYGSFFMNGRNWGAHRVSYIIAHNLPLETYFRVRHTCDNPKCVNPSHLETGTAKQNSQDMVDRGRSLKGERNTHAALTEADVVEMAALYLTGRFTQQELADRFQITKISVSRILRKETWRHVERADVSEVLIAHKSGEAMSNPGEQSGAHKLTEAQVREIRAIYAGGGCSQTELGRRYGVSAPAIRKIINGKSWRHLDQQQT